MCWVNYDKIALSIKAAIDRRPSDKGAYDDLFSLCRGWEAEDFAAAHALNKELIGMCAAQIRNGGKEAAHFYEIWRKGLLFEAPHNFDAFMTYIELDRKPEKRFSRSPAALFEAYGARFPRCA